MKSVAILATLPLVAYALPTGSFSYKPDSDKAPNSWPGLAFGEEYDNQCGGSKQSGIDIPTHTCDVSGDYIFSGGSCSLDDIDFTINDHAIVATYNTERNGCTPPRMRIPGQDRAFDALQFHIHTGTDHAIDGRYFGSVMHLVHKEVGSGRLSVLGYFFEPTDADGISKFSDLLKEWEAVAANTILACKADGVTLWSSQTNPFDDQTTGQQSGGRRVKEAEQDHRKLPRSFNPYDLIPAGSSMYTYEGSLTTPPCTEIVFWNVIDVPVSISVREFLRLTNLIIDFADPDTCTLASEAAASGFTGRPVQNINGRKIERICPNGFEDSLAKTECPEPDPVVAPTVPTVSQKESSDESDVSGAFFASLVGSVAVMAAGIAFM